MKQKLSQALSVLQYLDEHPSEFNDKIALSRLSI